MWVNVFVEPPGMRNMIYNVMYANEKDEMFRGFGYWTGRQWEMVIEASSKASFPLFSDYGVRVTHYLPDYYLPEPPRDEVRY